MLIADGPEKNLARIGPRRAVSSFNVHAMTGTTAMAVDAKALDSLPISAYLVICEAKARLPWPREKRGQTFRGGIGLTFRKLVCHDISLDCRECPLEPQCAYPAVFRARPPETADRLSNYADIPQPFILATPDTAAAGFEAGERFMLRLVLVGSAAQEIPLFLMSLKNLADEGIGPSRAQFEIVEVRSQCPGTSDEVVYQRGNSRVRPMQRFFRAQDLMVEGDESRNTLRLRFVTPAEIKDSGQLVNRPQFGPWFRRLRDRANALAVFFGSGAFDVDFKALGDLANDVRLIEHRTDFGSRQRSSSRTGQTHPIAGFSGEATYEGEALGAFMPFVRLAEWVSVGKHATFGQGRVEVVG